MSATNFKGEQEINEIIPAICKTLVVKATARCNLNCNYCYMFNGGDKTYLQRPAIMSNDVVDALIRRVTTHCHRHGISKFTFVLHGGEPLLAGMEFYRNFVGKIHSAFSSRIRPIFAMQTNATLLTEEWCHVLHELDIGLGISLDGPKEINDRQRLDHKGHGSFDRVLAGWKLAVSHGLNPGMLSVIDINSDPLQIYSMVKDLKPKSVDFLFPDATHDKPPPGYVRLMKSDAYSDWLIKIFDAWVADGNPNLKIRIFNLIMRSILGCNDGFDAMGSGNNEVLVVESDGEIQPVDVLRFCKEGITHTKFNVTENELDDAFQNELIRLYYQSHARLCSTCQQCTLKEICGGGFLPHRYHSSNGFDNPSVYCRDLTKLITKIQHWLISQLPQKYVNKLKLHPI